jgi:hypothetical protein
MKCIDSKEKFNWNKYMEINNITVINMSIGTVTNNSFGYAYFVYYTTLQVPEEWSGNMVLLQLCLSLHTKHPDMIPTLQLH